MSLETNPNLLRDAFLYFAKFPDYTELQKLFKRQPGTSAFSDYSALKAEIEAFAEEERNLIPAIKKLVFAPDEERLKKQIEDVGDGIFMLVDYGNIDTGQDATLKYKTDNMGFALTIARCKKPENMDVPELMLIGDETLNIIRQIREQMIADQQCSPFMRQILFPHQIVPWFARDLQNSHGWTMVMQRQGIEML